MSHHSQSITSPEDQSATFVELFFDLVFVYSVTQVVGLLHHEFNWHGVGQGVLVFWLVWWAWTQFTWALNAANTEHHQIRFWTLVATAVAFFMAVALPDAFHGGAMAFAIPYVLVRVIGLGLYSWVASENAAQRTAVKTFGLISIAGLIAVLCGAMLHGSAQYWIWGLAILLDVLAAAVGGQQEGWDLHPEHFGERHALFVIIALGETLIVAASGLAGATLEGETLAVAVLAVSASCALWWTYFPKSQPTLEKALGKQTGASQSGMARDVYSLAHFPMMGGVIAFAVAVESVVRHPTDPMALGVRLALALGLLLFVGGMALAMWRATCGRLIPRVAIITVTSALVVAASGVPPVASLAIAFAGVASIAIIEHRMPPAC